MANQNPQFKLPRSSSLSTLTSLSTLATLSFLLAGCSLPFLNSTTKVPSQPVPITESSPTTNTADTTPTTPPIVGGDKDEHGCLGSAGYQWCAPKDKCLRIWEEACYVPETSAIKAALVAKHGWDPTTIDITINQLIDDKYASGSVKEVGVETGGGLVFAAKVDGSWQIVADGNGITECSSLNNYPDFPASLLPTCYTPATGQVTNR